MLVGVLTILVTSSLLKITASQEAAVDSCASGPDDDVCMLQVAVPNKTMEPLSASGRKVPKADSQCNRQCRWKFGFNQRNIIGQRRAKCPLFDFMGSFCRCIDTAGGSPHVIDHGKLIPRSSEKKFDPDTWQGNFSTDLVCTVGEDLWSVDDLKTMTRDTAKLANRTVIHCGECSACSDMSNVIVLSLTRKWITHVMTEVSADFAAPITGHGNVTRLQTNLFKLGMNFSMTRPDGRTDRDTCMDAWTDSIQSTGFSCSSKCFIKFFDQSNDYVDITNCDQYSLLDRLRCECLLCDEMYSGPAFIKQAGASRRSTGIQSDIDRPAQQICPVGFYSGVKPEDLPTLPAPSDKRIAEVLYGRELKKVKGHGDK